jgi:threonine synthase
MLRNLKLHCTKCNREYSPREPFPRCRECNEPLELELITKGQINKGNILNQTILERYKDFLPFKIDNSISLNEGFTPLVKTDILGFNSLYIKNETQNPSWSFKDRGTISGVLHASSLGYEKIGTVSTGNMAVSVAAYGARAGLKTYILVGSHMPDEKLAPIAIHNPVLIKVDGNYGELYFKSLEIGREQGIYFINSDVPFRIEGYKTLSFEICEQLDFDIPDYVVVPTSAGGNIRGILKGFIEFYKAGIIKKMPRMICAQSEGCSPLVDAFSRKLERIEKVKQPNTIAHAIENPYPPSGNEVLRKLRKYNGLFVSVNDSEIIEAQRLMAEKGIFVQPASAVPIAAINKLANEDKIKKNDKIVCVATGSGLKYTKVLEKHNLNIYNCRIEELAGHIRGDQV